LQITWRAFFRIKYPNETFLGKILWHLININGMIYLADAMQMIDLFSRCNADEWSI